MSRADTVGAPEWLTTTTDEQVWLRTQPSGNLMLAALGVAFTIQEPVR